VGWVDEWGAAGFAGAEEAGNWGMGWLQKGSKGSKNADAGLGQAGYCERRKLGRTTKQVFTADGTDGTHGTNNECVLPTE